MPLLKYAFLFCWSLVLVAMVIVIIRSHPFIRRIRGGNLNLSEAIYALSLLVCGTFVLSLVLQTLATDFDITQKFYADRVVITLVTSGSLITVAGIFVFILCILAGRGLSTLLFFNRRPLIEFEANNIGYSVLRAGLLLSIVLLFTPFCGNLFQNLLPAISTPFYR